MLSDPKVAGRALFQRLYTTDDQKKILVLRASRKLARESRDAGTGRRNWNCEANRYSKEESDFILRFVKARWSYTEIARTLDRIVSGISTRYRDYLQYQDLDAPPVAVPARIKNDERTATIVQLANNGMHFTKIAAQLHMSPSVVRRRYSAACPEDRANGAGKRDFTAHELELIAQRVREGKSRSAIGVEIGRSSVSIQKAAAAKALGLASAQASLSKFSRSELDSIRLALESNACLMSLARELNRSYESVFVRSQRMSLTPSHPKLTSRRLTWEERREVLRLHDTGQPVSTIALQIGRSIETTTAALQAELSNLGLEFPRPDMKQNNWTHEEEIRLVRLRDERHLSFDEISASMGLTKNSVKSKYPRIKAALAEQPWRQCKWPPEKITQLLRLRDEDGLLFSTIATTMGITQGSARAKYHHLKTAGLTSTDSVQTASEPAAVE